VTTGSFLAPCLIEGTAEATANRSPELGPQKYLWYCGAAQYDAPYKTGEQALKSRQDAGLGSDRLDANDIIFCNHTMAACDVAPNLPKVKAIEAVIKLIAEGQVSVKLPGEQKVREAVHHRPGRRHPRWQPGPRPC